MLFNIRSLQQDFRNLNYLSHNYILLIEAMGVEYLSESVLTVETDINSKLISILMVRLPQ